MSKAVGSSDSSQLSGKGLSSNRGAVQTAEMPGFYQEGEYDVAGFAVGAVKQDAVIDGSRISKGDVLLGFASSGVHSNGFSLVRKILEVCAMLCLTKRLYK